MNLYLSIGGIFVALILMILLLSNGVNVYVSAIVCSVVVCLTSGLNVYATMTGDYMSGFVSFLQSWFLVFFFGAIFGRLMTISGATHVAANMIIKVLGVKWSMLMLPIAVGALVYGGVNAYVGIFAIFPIILAVFKEADAPKRFIPVMYLFGSGTFANCGPGTPQILNVVATQALGVSPMACAGLGFVGVAATMIIGLFWYNRFLQKAKANGEHYTLDPKLVQYEQTDEEAARKQPGKLLSLLPLVVTLVCVNIKSGGENIFELEEALIIGILAVCILHFKYLVKDKIASCLADSTTSAITMACSTCAVLGFATVIKATSAFSAFVELIPSIPLPPTLSLIIATNIICLVTGAASGSAAIVAPLLGPIYTSMGMDPAWVARLIAVSATGCDSVPHNGSIVAYINMCGETHKTAYKPIFCMCLVTPLIATAIMCLASLFVL